MFLTEAGTRHALLVKNKTFAEENLGKAARDGKGQPNQPLLIQEESDDDLRMDDIAQANDNDEDDDEIATYQEDKKKLLFNTTYDGFNIWGFILCLLVERKGTMTKPLSGGGTGGGSAQALMEEWISTQQAQDEDL